MAGIAPPLCAFTRKIPATNFLMEDNMKDQDDKIFVIMAVVFVCSLLLTCVVPNSGSHKDCKQWKGSQHLACMGGKG